MKQRSWVSEFAAAAPLVVLALLYALDVRDLCNKLVWLGPPDTFSFEAQRSSGISAEPLVPPNSFNASQLYTGAALAAQYASPWLAFYDRCESLHAGDARVFDTFIATRCELGTFAGEYVANTVLFSTSVRADTIAWAACKLLMLHRRPPLCQEPVVADVARRYGLDDPDVRARDVAAASSDAEFELLRLLGVLSRAKPFEQTVCAEGFEIGGPGEYAPSLLACASPSAFESAIAGRHATALGRTHAGLAWLAVDTVRVLGFDFVVRQHSHVAFILDDDGDRDTTIATVTQRARVNVSSFGHLYIALVVADVLLLIISVYSSVESVRVLGVFNVDVAAADGDALLPASFSWFVLYRSLFRSKRVLALSALAAALSWITVLPLAALAVDWDVGGTNATLLLTSTHAAWVLVLALLHVVWDAAVALNEARAYAVARATHISVAEVLAVVAVVTTVERGAVRDVARHMRALGATRLWDDKAFTNHVATANAVGDALDHSIDTSTAVLRVLYTPLATVVCESLVVIVAVLALRAAIWTREQRARLTSREVARVAAEIEVIESADDLDASLGLLSSATVAATDPTDAAYSRLPLEQQLQLPIRARALVRSTAALEVIVADELYIAPTVYFDAGLCVANGRIRTRCGFANVVHPRVAVAHAVLAAAQLAHEDATERDARAGSPSKASSTARAKAAAVASLVFATDVPGTAGSTGSTGGAGVGGAAASASGIAINGDKVGGVPGDVATGRRPLAEAANAAAARSMRRRKSTNEFTLVEL